MFVVDVRFDWSVFVVGWSSGGSVTVDIDVFTSDLWLSFGDIFDNIPVMAFTDNNWVSSNNFGVNGRVSNIFVVNNWFSVNNWLSSDNFRNVVGVLVSDNWFSSDDWFSSDNFVVDWSFVGNNGFFSDNSDFVCWVDISLDGVAQFSGVFLTDVLRTEMVADSGVVWEVVGENIVGSWSVAFVLFEAKSDNFTQNMVLA